MIGNQERHGWGLVGVAAIVMLAMLAGAYVWWPREDPCEVLAQQAALVDADAIRDLERYGMAYLSGDVPQPVPEVMILDELLPDCHDRLMAERYIQNKIAGRPRFALDPSEFQRAKPAVARAVYMAITAARPMWRDGTAHEIFNAVSDDIADAWVPWLVEMIPNYGVDPALFPPILFRHPPDAVVAFAKRTLQEDRQNSLYLHEAAMRYFLLRNAGLVSEPSKALADLASKPGYGGPQQESPMEDIERALNQESIPIRFAYDVYYGAVGY